MPATTDPYDAVLTTRQTRYNNYCKPENKITAAEMPFRQSDVRISSVKNLEDYIFYRKIQYHYLNLTMFYHLIIYHGNSVDPLQYP
jgi:hypothetical protein